jgi:hypothetical protein
VSCPFGEYNRFDADLLGSLGLLPWNTQGLDIAPERCWPRYKAFQRLSQKMLGSDRGLEPGACRARPLHSVMKGSTTVMSSEDTSAFLKTIDTSHVVGLRDRVCFMRNVNE